MAQRKSRKAEEAFVFLDFDGVLNSERYFARNVEAKGNGNLDTGLVQKMLGFVEDIGGVVVVSSTWREGRTVGEIRSILKERGFKKTAIIKGKTPKLYDEDDEDAPRGIEIEHYMKKHQGVPFVIFDDDGDMEPVEKFLVQTDPRMGVTARDFQKARRILKRQGHRG